MIKTRYSRGSPKEQGAITPILAACLAMGLGLLAMTVDLGQLFVAKNELQNIADAAALAAAQKLIQAQSQDNPQAVVRCSDAISAAQAVAADNKSIGLDTPLTVSDADVVIGKWDLNTFTPTGCSSDTNAVNAVQVTVHRDGEKSLGSFFGSILGTPTMNSQATAVAYLGWAATAGTSSSPSLGIPFAVSSNPNGSFPGVSRSPLRQTPYARSNPLDWFMPQPAHAATTLSFTWKDLGGSTLNAQKGTFIMPNSSERTDLGQLQRYIKGPNAGGDNYPKVNVGQKVFPISEYKWASNVYNNFTYLKNRYNSEKAANGKWRVLVGAYYTTNPTAAAPTPPSTWLGLAQRLLGPKPAYACMSYTSPVTYLEGFITVDVTGVTCNSTCKNYDYPDSRSCYNKCYMNVEVPLDQTNNFVVPNSTPTYGDAIGPNYKDMNPSAPNVGAFASVPYLVK